MTKRGPPAAELGMVTLTLTLFPLIVGVPTTILESGTVAPCDVGRKNWTELAWLNPTPVMTMLN